MKNSEDPEEKLHKRQFVRINTVFYDKLDLQSKKYNIFMTSLNIWNGPSGLIQTLWTIQLILKGQNPTFTCFMLVQAGTDRARENAPHKRPC